MYRLNQFIYNSYVLILILMLLVGGLIQYFLGFPNTVYTILIVGYIWFLVLLHTAVSGKVYISSYLIWSLVLFLVILLSGLINGTYFSKVLLYAYFAFNPLIIFYLHKVLDKRKINYRPFLVKFSRFVALAQLPIVLIQKYGYEFLIKFNNSSQGINDYDFMFGTFFIKADHALGFFILFYIINIIFRIRRKEIKKIPWFLLTYLSLTIFIMESNLSKLMLILVLLYYVFLWLYSKINFLGIFAIAFMGIIAFNLLLKIDAVNAQYRYFKSKYTPQESAIAFERGYAKRPQVVVTFATRKPFEWIGHGPYDYFNLLTGKFKKPNHFSQLIWTYNDLGIIGLLTMIIIAFFLTRSLLLDLESFILIFGFPLTSSSK